MKRANKGGKRVVPQPGGESFQLGEAGPLVYTMPIGPVRTRVRWTSPGGPPAFESVPPMTPEEWRAYCEQKGILLPDRPLVPTAAELAKLPAGARAAFLARCAARVAPLAGAPAPAALDPAAAIAILVAAATVETPLRRQLRCVRRDFDRLVFLAKKHNWADDTPVPPEVFGPMWPGDLAPAWAAPPA